MTVKTKNEAKHTFSTSGALIARNFVLRKQRFKPRLDLSFKKIGTLPIYIRRRLGDSKIYLVLHQNSTILLQVRNLLAQNSTYTHTYPEYGREFT